MLLLLLLLLFGGWEEVRFQGLSFILNGSKRKRNQIYNSSSSSSSSNNRKREPMHSRYVGREEKKKKKKGIGATDGRFLLWRPPKRAGVLSLAALLIFHFSFISAFPFAFLSRRPHRCAPFRFFPSPFFSPIRVFGFLFLSPNFWLDPSTQTRTNRGVHPFGFLSFPKNVVRRVLPSFFYFAAIYTCTRIEGFILLNLFRERLLKVVSSVLLVIFFRVSLGLCSMDFPFFLVLRWSCFVRIDEFLHVRFTGFFVGGPGLVFGSSSQTFTGNIEIGKK